MPRKQPGADKPKQKAPTGNGTVFQRGRDGKWVATLTIGWDVVDGKRKRKTMSKVCATQREADDWLAKQKTDRNGGTLLEPSKETVNSFVSRWLAETLVHEVGPSTQRIYRNLFDWYINPALGSVKLQQLNPQQIQRLAHKLLESGKSGRTVQMTLQVLNRACKQALAWGIIVKNPCDAVRRPRADTAEMKVLTDDQITAFVEAARKERLHALYILAVTFALREGELIALRWKDVDLATGTVTVRETRKTVLDHDGRETWEFGAPKTKAARRTIPLAAVTVDAMRRWHAEQAAEHLAVGLGKQKPSDLIFDSVEGTPLNPNNLRGRSFVRIMTDIGMTERVERQKVAKDGTRTRARPLIRFHDLRHTAATFMLSHGVPPEVVQKIMGHTDITTTLRIYRHVFEHEKREAAQKVDDFLKTANNRTR